MSFKCGKVHSSCRREHVLILQLSVINTMKSMVTDDGVLEKEDLFILNRMKEFISSDEVSRFAAAKHLMIQIERLVRLRHLSFCA